MISLQDRITAFSSLGEKIKMMVCAEDASTSDELEEISTRPCNKNPWFTIENILKALDSIASMLEETQLVNWMNSYPWTRENRAPKTIAVIMAGNIPAVGFHDALCVLITGNKLLAKPSSKDDVILPFLLRKLCEIEPSFASKIQIEDGLIKEFDAIIATGSDNTSRYFEYYFKKYPHVIRKNRCSVAVLTGNETNEEIQGLNDDIFSYFGLGCRNVSKIFLPDNFDITLLFNVFDKNKETKKHFKYMNNYEYNKSIYLLNQESHLDNGFLILKEDSKIFSPIAVVFYEKYTDISTTREYINNNLDKLQCVVSNVQRFDKGSVAFGTTQKPGVFDYADDVDTIKFIETI